MNRNFMIFNFILLFLNLTGVADFKCFQLPPELLNLSTRLCWLISKFTDDQLALLIDFREWINLQLQVSNCNFLVLNSVFHLLKRFLMVKLKCLNLSPELCRNISSLLVKLSIQLDLDLLNHRVWIGLCLSQPAINLLVFLWELLVGLHVGVDLLLCLLESDV